MYDYDSNDDEDEDVEDIYEDEIVDIMPSSSNSPSNRSLMRQESSLLLRCASELADKSFLRPGMEEETGSDDDVHHDGVCGEHEANRCGDGLMEGLGGIGAGGFSSSGGLGCQSFSFSPSYSEREGDDDSMFDFSLPSSSFDLHSAAYSRSEKQDLFSRGGSSRSSLCGVTFSPVF